MATYFAAVVAIGVYFTRRQHDAGDYFLGRHSLPWWAVMFSIVATETSALTVISVPGIAARGDLTFLQLPVGYLVGRLGVAAWLLPGYFRGEQETAYARLEARFGRGTRKIASGIFMGIRALGDSVRVFATAIPLAIIIRASDLPPTLTEHAGPLSIAIIMAVTVAYTWAGGIKAVIWVDVLQMTLYTLGGVATILVAGTLITGGVPAGLEAAATAGKLKAVDWSLSLSSTYTFWSGLVGGALLSAASHGTDHLIVQRLLATRALPYARRALVGSGLLVILQFALFLLVGTLLWAAGAAAAELSGDELYPTFVVRHLPPGVAGLVVAGLLAAAMSTVSSSLNSLASAATHDFYVPLTGRRDARHLLTVGRWATVGWALVLAAGALSFRSTETPAVELALSIASITYGALLGTYILAGLAAAVRQADAVLAIATATVSMVIVVLVKPGPFATLAWPWYVPLGTALTCGVGLASGAFRRLMERP